jgi:hypothetical protein
VTVAKLGAFELKNREGDPKNKKGGRGAAPFLLHRKLISRCGVPRVWPALQSRPIIIRAVGILSLRLSLLQLFRSHTQTRFSGYVVLHLARKHNVLQTRFHVVELGSRNDALRLVR